MAIEVLVGVRGESFANEDGKSRQEIIRTLRAGMPVTLVADPNNEHDRRAVKVLTAGGEQIGFLPSDARDSDAVLKGEPIEATIHSLNGGTNWFQRMLGKRSIGVVLKIRKGDPDWGRRRALEEIARPVDEIVKKALEMEKSAKAEEAIAAMLASIELVRELTNSNPYASAHRQVPAPVDRLSMLLERQKRFVEALEVIAAWKTTFDPVQPGKAVCDTLRKRAERLSGKAL